MGDPPGLDEQLALAQVLDDHVFDLVGREPLERTEAGHHSPGLVDRRDHRQVVHPRQLEVVGPGAGRDVNDPRPFGQRDVVPGDDPMGDTSLSRQVVERSFVLEADELLAPRDTVISFIGHGQPPAAVAQPVLRVRLDGGGDVRGKCPGRRRPDDERLAFAVLKRKADVERRVVELPVVLLSGLLVL